MTTQAQYETVNGVDVAALKQAIAQIEAKPEAGQTHWTVKSRWQGGTRTDHFVDGFDIGGQKVDRQFQIQIDEPCELCGSNQYANPQEYLLAALNACVTVGYVAQCSVRGIELEYVEIETTGEIDLRGFLGIDPGVANGYESLTYTVRIKGNGTPEQFAEVHEAVIATSPNFYNVSHPVALKPTLVVE